VNRPVAVAAALALLVAACAPAPLRPTAAEPQPAAASSPDDDEYVAAARRGERVYRVDGGASLVVIEVRRAGSLSQFGHDHVVASRSARGHVDATRRRADLRFRLDELTVDEPALREEAGFTTRPTAEDIAGTRANMLERVLESDRHAEAADHVVASRSARGHVDATRRRADVRFRLDELTVDEPALRDQAGFTTRPSAEDIAGTRANMLERVLESDRYAEAAVHVESREGGPLTVTLTLHGIAREIDVPVAVEVSDDAVEASGRCELRLSDFGMAPVAILGGAIRVDDTVVVRFRIRATRLAG
jgi:hypothetical protein